MRAAGHGADWRRTDEEREATRRAALADRRDRDLWVFGYGSLMWDPGLHFAELRQAKLDGFHRSFCLRTRLGRGSFEHPGLMAALDTGGTCHGLAFRVEQARLEEETRLLWAREMIMPAYDPVFRTVETPQGTVEALAFVINHSCENYMAELERDDAARLIASAHGLFGSNLAYLDNLASHFRLLGIPDPAFFALYDRARHLADNEGSVADR